MGATQTKDAKLEQLKRDVYHATLIFLLAKRGGELNKNIELYETLLREAQYALDEYMLIKDVVAVRATGTIQ